MNVVDVVLVLVVLLALWAGWVKGFILGFVDLLIWLGSLFIGFFVYKSLGELLDSVFPSLGVWILPLAFIITIIAARVLLSLVFNKLLKTTPAATHQTTVNRLLGIFPGLVKGFIYATVIAALLLSVPLSDTISASTRDSKLAGKLALQVEWLDNKLSPIFGDAAKETMNKLTVEPDSEETVILSFKVDDPKPRPDLEAKMLDLVNQERVKRGLNPVKADPELTEVARAHSKDMFQRGYFSHYTLENKDPFDRMKAAGVRYMAAGENLALGKTLNICHNGLMNSPGHKANILSKNFGRLGIGIMDGGFHGLMISQEFRN